MNNLFLSAEGRIPRKQYWLGTIIIGLISSMFGIAERYVENTTVQLVVASVVALVFLYPGICIGVKRCHDRGRSGWFLLVGLIPLVGGIWLLVELGFLKGTPGPNRFGPDPLPSQQPLMA